MWRKRGEDIGMKEQREVEQRRGCRRKIKEERMLLTMLFCKYLLSRFWAHTSLGHSPQLSGLPECSSNLDPSHESCNLHSASAAKVIFLKHRSGEHVTPLLNILHQPFHHSSEMKSFWDHHALTISCPYSKGWQTFSVKAWWYFFFSL